VDRRRALTRGGTLAALALLALYVLLGGDLSFPGGDGGKTTATTTPTVATPLPEPGPATEAEAQQTDDTAPAPTGGNSEVSAEEAAGITATLARIDSGGPLPYDQDGTTFSNREGRLPEQSDGYYKEYTVQTPGSDDRGARRLVIGAGGETFYTGDHYDSFIQIDPGDYR
jgi:ribonuclease T1